MYGGAFEFSGERFEATYRLFGAKDEALGTAKAIAVEQTIEFPQDLVDGPIAAHVVGRLTGFEEGEPGSFDATISYALESAGAELTQFLNVLFGNSSLLPRIRLMRVRLSPGLARRHAGPRHGRGGVRALVGADDGPLLATALKPMGLGANALAGMAYELALGGIDLIKDDHGLADQPFAAFAERLEKCVSAVERGRRDGGTRAVYVPNVTAPGGETLERARLARAAGAGALLVAPGLVGFDRMEELAREVGLPIISHPAFLGGFVAGECSGIDHYALFGQLQRLAGADVVVFPNYGGRFSFSQSECRRIVRGVADDLAGLAPILPAPGGGMTLARTAELLEFYGDDVVFLIGGDLHRGAAGVAANARALRDKVEERRAGRRLSAD